MNGVTIGARVYAVVDGSVFPVQILDRAPGGWWANLEGTAPAGGRNRVENVPSRFLFPSQKQADAALASSPAASRPRHR